ncbi:MAG: hypothetical protein U1E57_04290 [Paenacidovorax caeni]
MDCLRPVAHPQAREGHAHRPGDPSQLVFVRDDQPRSASCKQLALAIREEVLDLERPVCTSFRSTKAALREGLPLRKAQWPEHRTGPWRVSASPPMACATRRNHTHMYTRSSPGHRVDRRDGCRRDHHRDLALGHGAARRLR